MEFVENVDALPLEGQERIPLPVTDGDENPAPAVTESNGAPVPDISGTFAVYTLPSGAVILSWWTEQHGEGQTEVPAIVVKQAMAMAGGKGGGPLGVLSKLRGRRG